MTKQCRAPGCARAAKTYGHYCTKHAKVQRRHGAATQRPLSHSEMKQGRLHIRKLIDSRANAGAIWEKLLESLEQVKREALTETTRKGAGFRWMRDAERDILSVLGETQPEDVILSMCAIGYMRQVDGGRRFVNDEAVWISAGTRFRRLGRSLYRETVHPVTGKRHLTPEDVSPKRLRHIGVRLLTVFAPIGAALQEAEVLAERKAEEARTAALQEITGGAAHA